MSDSQALGDGTEQARGKGRRNVIIVVVVALVAAALGIGAWWYFSRPADVQRADVVRFDKERSIVDNSMNLYDPLVQEFTARYTNVSKGDALEEQDAVLKREADLLQRESAANMAKLDRMAESPALQDPAVSDAFGKFKEKYGAVVAYNDQRIINTASITRSVGGPCGPLHTELNLQSENYSAEYVKVADACLKAIAEAKDGTDAETNKLLTAVEGVIKGQRDKQQEVLDADEDLVRIAKRTLAAAAMLGINEPLNKARTEYEAAVKEKSTKVVADANAANQELEKVLKSRLEQFEAASGDGDQS
ncbi:MULTISPECIES: hypothetical protein [Paenarthrobacter]|uniref:hypothetical protein n=1 Tax=Paenarthrobacter TaxID=1742992 RepID=UPI0006990B2A|nr:hypothetical protein [Paenarthrobacter ureafaciens]AMB42400.1 hypothetical protein AUT26_04505 [Arthrobacter sp. ATCC 21022]RWW95787.1 hypothetical protein AUR_15050 [Paenarthrobacter ureafaciens]